MSFWKTFCQSKEVNTLGSEPKLKIHDIQYHLSKLFEAEVPLIAKDYRLTEVNRSIINFGVEDVQLLSASLDRSQLAIKIKGWIENFEPRLQDIQVILHEHKEGQNALHFSISAHYQDDFGLQELNFDSRIALSDFTSSVEEENYD
ncbi:type VI secretion system baseplate subunit TssE [Vibrio sp.]|nr:type VI secretion system baseplate subunit TssE [Vibrio sp.]